MTTQLASIESDLSNSVSNRANNLWTFYWKEIKSLSFSTHFQFDVIAILAVDASHGGHANEFERDVSY